MRNSSATQSDYLQSSSKRILDIVVAVATFLPLLFVTLISGLLLLFFEGRPIFFKHERVGRYGNFIDVVKLRTLRKGSDPYELSPGNGSQRILRIGKFLRKHKLDEMPQLILVLKGEMSIVGPRPELETLVCNYKENHFVYRLNAKPGLTGLWQIKADTSRPIYENIKYDLYYLRKASLVLDLKLIMLTLIFILRNRVV